MGRIVFSHILFLLGIVTPSWAQTDTAFHLTWQKTIYGPFRDFYADNLGNLYLINTDNRIKKLNAHGDSIAVYNDQRRYGDLFSMDVTNPFKEIIFYKDYQTIVVVDKFLNRLNTLNLRNYGIMQSTAVALSYDNNYWIFDEWSNTLKKIDDNGKLLLESADFRLSFGDGFNPGKIIDADGILYLYDPLIGWKIFDYYGHFKKNIPFPGWNDVQASKGMVYGWGHGNLMSASITLSDEHSFSSGLTSNTVHKIFFLGNVFYVLDEQGLSIYHLP
ncbi:MAG: hypothetical protein JSS67_08020 [Bacteroidetes bacterium]|nr:hypothetical protein [Bacteroidota bacterium]